MDAEATLADMVAIIIAGLNGRDWLRSGFNELLTGAQRRWRPGMQKENINKKEIPTQDVDITVCDVEIE